MAGREREQREDSEERKRGLIKEFKDFAMRGNVIDLAVGVIIGAAFGAIVSSLVADVITPLVLNPALDAAGVDDIQKLKFGKIGYGKFLAATINFLVIALCLFSILKVVNATHKKNEGNAVC